MNILIDVRLLGRGGLSGIEEYTRNLLKHLLKLDKENQYTFFYNGLRLRPLNFSAGGGSAFGGQYPPDNQQSNYKIINWRIPNKLLDIGTRFLDAPAIDSWARSDLVFSPHFNILKTYAPRVITFHDLSFIHHPYFFRWRQNLWHWLQNCRKQTREATKIIANSEFSKSDLINSLKIPGGKISVIYPGVNPEFKKLAPDDERTEIFREKYNLNYPFILYLGTLEPRKNVPAVIRAFNLLKKSRQFNDLKLVIAGRAGWLYKDILKEAKASPASGKIIFWGPVENRHRILLYNLAECFVYPSFFEGFGFPPLEAQACGTPVIVSERTSLPEIIKDSGMLVDPWRIDELAEKLKELLTNEGLRAELIKKGFENIKRFSWQRTAEETLKLFQEVKI